MPKLRKSLKELVEGGTLGKNLGKYQSRIASATTVVAPIGKAPAHLPAAERSVWAEVVKLSPPGALTKSDRLSLEILCRLTVRMRTSDFKSSELNALAAMLAKFGMSPGDRLKMNLEPLPEPKKQSEQDKQWAELDALD